MTRRTLARDWAAAVLTTAYLPMSDVEVEEHLLELVDGIVDQLAVGGSGTAPAWAAGSGLVAVHCTGQHSLQRSVEALAAGLPRVPELAAFHDIDARVIPVLGALGAGYADALRRKTFQQQEDVKQALARVLMLSEARFREVFTGSAIGIAISDLDGTLVQTNHALAEILGYEDAELVERNLRDLVHSEGAVNGDHLWLAYQDVVNGRSERFRIERPMVRKDGEQIWVYLAVSVLRDEAARPTHHVTMVEDITDLHLMQVQLNNQALHDVLTGLPNRQSFALRLESTLGQLDPAATVTLFHLDIDSFSVINDGLGHHVGDQLLRLVAQRLAVVFADERATIARIASDEFVVLVEDSPNTPDVATLAATINDELSEPAYLDGMGLAVTVGIGVVQRQAGGITPAELLRQSDSTLRRAKGNGKRQWAIFDRHQDRLDRDRFTMAAGMPGSLENGEFQVEYRPVARLSDDRVMAVEARIRWDHPDGGPLGHDEVMKLAEQTGMVLPIGQWLLRMACTQAVGWSAAFADAALGDSALGDGAPPLAINLATPQANDPDLVGTVNDVLGSTGLAPGLLQLGLPVRALLCEEGDAEDNLQVLADMGVGTSIHGFGGGHGGLVFLEDLPVQSVWIAGWLVDRLAERPESVTGRALHDLISLVHTFDATVVTAGVRTAEQAAWWRKAGGDLACGDWFAAPGPPDAIVERLLAGRRL